MGKRNEGNCDVFYSYEIRNMVTGKVRKKGKHRCRSFVAAFIILLYKRFSPVSLTLRDTSNVDQTLSIQPADDLFDVTALINDDTHGILIGTGTTAPTIHDNNVETKINHGSSAGELQYSSVTFGQPATDATSTEFVVTRTFTNGSGGTVTVEEIGLACSTGADNFLLIRDLLSSSTPVLNSEVLTINYTIKTTV